MTKQNRLDAGAMKILGAVLASIISAHLAAMGAIGFHFVSRGSHENILLESAIVLFASAAVFTAILSWRPLSVILSKGLLKLEKGYHEQP